MLSFRNGWLEALSWVWGGISLAHELFMYTYGGHRLVAIEVIRKYVQTLLLAYYEHCILVGKYKLDNTLVWLNL
jgi:hypothetical protein